MFLQIQTCFTAVKSSICHLIGDSISDHQHDDPNEKRSEELKSKYLYIILRIFGMMRIYF